MACIYQNERMLPIVLGLIPTIVGAGMLVGLPSVPKNKAALLFGELSVHCTGRSELNQWFPADYIVTFFGSSLAIVYAYNASNTSGHTKKVTVNAMTLAAFCLGNIIGSETFLPKDAPNYIPGKTAILILLCVSFVLCFVIRFINIRLNAKKRKFIQEMKERNGWTDEDIERERQRHAFLDMTDQQYVPLPRTPPFTRLCRRCS